jgi:macrophage erythroblast attacher
MADHEHATIKHSEHLLLDQPLLRLPNELLRKNFRSAHFTIEKDTSALKTLLKESATAAVSGRASQQDVLRNLDAMIARMRGVKRKLSAHADEEGRLHDQTGARIRHLDEMYSLHTYEDVKYEAWSRQRLDRLIADYFLRQGFLESARLLAKERDMEKLVDVETFENMGRIRLALLDGSVVEALAWCQDNKKELRKMESKLEFMLRFQQYVELIRLGTQEKLLEAIAHAKKWLIPFRAQYPKEVQQACGLLAMPPTASNAACYANVYKPRWQELADLFTTTHNQLLSLPSVPLLHIALSSGLSALKTPACHAHQQQQEKQEQEKKATTAPGKGAVAGGSSGNDDDTDGATITTSGPGAPIVHDTLGQGLCPICSTELNDLARYVPYAHHTKSHVQPDLVMLPSRKARSRQLLLDEAKKAGLEPDMVRDPVTQSLCHVDELKKVYIT